MASSESTTGTAAGSQTVGKVFIQYGTAKAVAADGTERALAPNSPIFAHDQIITDSDGSVSIMIDGHDGAPATQLDLGRMSHVTIDEDVYAGAAPGVTADATAEADKIQQALLAGDQPIDLDATAAGGDGGAGGGVTSPFSLSLTGAEGQVGSGAGTTGTEFGTSGTIQGAFAAPTDAPVVPPDAPVVPPYVHVVPPDAPVVPPYVPPVNHAPTITDGINHVSDITGGTSVYEAALANGSHVVNTTTDVTGHFTLSDADGLGDIKTVTINGETINIANLVGHTFAGEHAHGTLTIDGYDTATGIVGYHYDLTSAAVPGTHDAPENDVFTMTTSDGTASSDPAHITINIMDDVPAAYDTSGEAHYITIPHAPADILTGWNVDDVHGVGHATLNVLDADPHSWGITNHVSISDHIITITDPGSGNPEVRAVSSPEFVVADGHTANIHFDVNIVDSTSGDHFSWTLYHEGSNGDWSAVNGAGGTLTESDSVNYPLNNPAGADGTYRLVFDANDVTGGSDKFTVQIDDIHVTTPQPDTYQVVGDVHGTLQGEFGADGGHVDSIAALSHVDGKVIDGHSDTTPADGLKVTGEYGGVLDVNPSTGAYTYTAHDPSNAAGPGHETFSFTLIDGDGDTSIAQLDMLIHHDPPTVG
ncbi:MAG: hypothetical protein NT140_08235 [Deltaproteobacteria bacterium]|nr:hypothetical protein [Deltaproteobacteria bacterium]